MRLAINALPVRKERLVPIDLECLVEEFARLVRKLEDELKRLHHFADDLDVLRVIGPRPRVASLLEVRDQVLKT